MGGGGEQEEEDARRLRAGVEAANLPTLLCVLSQLTDDSRWRQSRYRPRRARGLEDNDDGGLSAREQSEVRAAAYRAIVQWRSGTPAAVPLPTADQATALLSLSVGEPVPREYGPLIVQELRVAENRADWLDGFDASPPPGFKVAIIGAGLSGVAAAVALRAAGVNYEVFERAPAIGGVWFQNAYPGAGVDTPSHLYSYSFAPRSWSHYFATQAEIREYITDVAEGVRDRIRLSHEVRCVRYREDIRQWEMEIVGPDGAVSTTRAHVVISAVGAFNVPATPQIPGADKFNGRLFHAAQWPRDDSVTGRRVAIVGSGATAMQLVPAIADKVDHLTVFQRTPQWVAPFAQLGKTVPREINYLMDEVPLYRAWYRIRLGWIFNDKNHAALQKDPSWPFPERAVNAHNDAHRKHFEEYVRKQLVGREDLIEKSVPTYPAFGKRILLDNGWYRAIRRDNVTLETQSIAELTSTGLVTSAGKEIEVDTVVFATGFNVVSFLSTIEVRGRAGIRLRDAWRDDDARAYLGMTMPHFPNFFCLYGPNTQAGHGGSLIGFSEMQVRYVLNVLQEMFRANLSTVEVREDLHDAYNARIDAAHANMIWTHPGMEVYYRNARGRVVVNTPFRIVDYWHMSRRPNFDDFMVE